MGKGWRTALQPDAEGEDSRTTRADQGTYSTFPVTSNVLALSAHWPHRRPCRV